MWAFCEQIVFFDEFVFDTLLESKICTLTCLIFKIDVCEIRKINIHFADSPAKFSAIQNFLCLCDIKSYIYGLIEGLKLDEKFSNLIFLKDKDFNYLSECAELLIYDFICYLEDYCVINTNQ